MTATRIHLLASAALAVGALAASPLAAQGTAVVQALPDPASQRLAEALRALAREPRSLSLLVQAGEASLALDDVSAAEGFFKRAQAVDASDGRVKAGMASLLVRQDQPVEALRLFAEAEQTGAPMGPSLGDRGLAYDMVGDNARAQQDYQRALALGPDAAVSRRLALSQAISGNQAGAEATLLPMLQQTDLAAFRTRAFALAIAGKSDEAVSIAQTMLPERISSRLAPYLRFMPRLTRAQQAAAANLGRFPQADQIGKDSPEIAALSAAARPAFTPADTRAGVALAAAEPARDSRRNRRQQQPAVATGRAPLPAEPAVAAAPPPPARPAVAAPAVEVVQPKAPATSVVAAAPAPISAPIPAPAPAPAPAAAPTVVAVTPAPAVAAAAMPATTLAANTVVAPKPEPERPVAVPVVVARLPQDVAASVAAPASQPAPTVVPAVQPEPAPQTAPEPTPSQPTPSQPTPPQPAPPTPRDLQLAFADFAPAGAAAGSVPEGAVDMARFTPRREPKPEAAKPAPAKPAPPPKPVIPSRHWAQIGTGRDLGAMQFTWKQLKKDTGGLLDKYQPLYADWGRTNRLVVGPFSSAAEAERFVGKLKAKKFDAFRFTSDEGEDVKPLK